MATKTARKSANGTKPKPDSSGIVRILQPNGSALLAGGVPGNAGGTGRPPNWLKDWCDDLLAKPGTKKAVEAILADSKHTAFAAMWKAVGDRAHGKPTETKDVTLSGRILVTNDILAEPTK